MTLIPQKQQKTQAMRVNRALKRKIAKQAGAGVAKQYGLQPRYTSDQFKFANQKKQEITQPQASAKNRAKRLRRTLRGI